MAEGETSELSKARPWWRRHIVLLVVLALAAIFLIDAFVIEPNNIQITRYTIHAGIHETLKIADLSDMHTRGLGRPERRMLGILEAEKPDAILITGDTLADPFGNYEDCVKLYKQLHAPLGVWFVRGNWENWHPLRHERQFYRDAGINLLVNQNHELAPDVWLVGLDDPYSGRANLSEALRGVPENAYKIAMFHSPYFFQTIAGKVNLVLAGHTHGGQIRIPFVKPFWLPGGSGPYLEGWYEERGSRMYVNRGMGMSEIPARFLARPEVTLIALTH